jgi:glycerol-3-phosphate acyltransferase PlsY
MDQNLLISGLFLASYLLGSVPFGVIISRLYKVDITKVGSGNIGTTNVLRTLGVIPAAMVLAGDFAKGLVPIYAAQFLELEPLFIVAAGLCAILGHSFPIFLKFKGGRGSATGLGVLLGITPDVFLLAAIIAATIIAFTRYVSLASIVTSIVVVVSMYFLDKPLPYIVGTSIIVFLIIVRHIPNIGRLFRGEERKVGEKAK